MPTGSYPFHAFGGHDAFPINRRFYTFRFPQQHPGFRIEEPGIYFLGSYKVKDTGTIFSSNYEIGVVSTPAERQVLEKILPHTQGTLWEARLRRRLEDLK